MVSSILIVRIFDPIFPNYEIKVKQNINKWVLLNSDFGHMFVVNEFCERSKLNWPIIIELFAAHLSLNYLQHIHPMSQSLEGVITIKIH